MLPTANSSFSSAAADLGLGDMLGEQVAGETEEMRKKRMAQKQQPGMGGSAAAMSLFGPGAALGGLGG